MEVLYAIISIGLIIILIMSLVLLFRSKSNAKKKRDKNETTVRKLIHGLFSVTNLRKTTPKEFGI